MKTTRLGIFNQVVTIRVFCKLISVNFDVHVNIKNNIILNKNSNKSSFKTHDVHEDRTILYFDKGWE